MVTSRVNDAADETLQQFRVGKTIADDGREWQEAEAAVPSPSSLSIKGRNVRRAATSFFGELQVNSL